MDCSEEYTDKILEKIKENAKLILKNNYKFYSFLYLGGHKIKLLSEGNSRKAVEKESIKEFKYICCDDIEKMLRFHQKDVIYIFQIRKPTKEEIDEELEGKKEYKEQGLINLSKIKGKLLITSDAHKVIIDKKNDKNPISLKNLNAKGHSLSSKYWLNNRYLAKYDEVPILHLNKILGVLETGSPFAIRKMSDVIKKKQPYGLTA